MSVKQLANLLGQLIEQTGSERSAATALGTTHQRLRYLLGKDGGKGRVITEVSSILLRRLQRKLRLSDQRFWHLMGSELDSIIEDQDSKLTAAGKDQGPEHTNRRQNSGSRRSRKI